MGGWLNHYSLRCQPVDYTDNPVALRVSDETMLVGSSPEAFARQQLTFHHMYINIVHYKMPICKLYIVFQG